MRWLAQSSLALLCVSCSGLSLSPGPALPIGEFYNHVLDPLAGTLADERITQAKAEVSSKKVSPVLATLLGSLFAPGAGSAIGGGLAALNNSSIEQQLAMLDTRRLPLKHELLQLFIGRTKTEGEHYRVCVEGVERVYAVQDGHFVRLANGPGPCEVTTLTSLQAQP